MKNFDHKNIWITGASSGIGRQLAVEFSRYQVCLILSSRNIEELTKVKEICQKNGANCYIQQLDLENQNSIDTAVENVLSKCDKIDILINNAGLSQRSYANETKFEVIRKIMEVNFFGTVSLTKKLLPKMIEQKKAHIVVITSVSGKFGFYLRSAYAASKHALHGFFEALYFENIKNGINITFIVPGRVKTNVGKNALTKDGLPQNNDQWIEKGMNVEKCAKKIIKAIKKNKYEKIIGKTDKLLVYIKKFFPKLFRIIVKNLNPR